MLRAESEYDICKQVYNCLSITKGGFVYNENIGSNISRIDIDSDNAEKTCELMVKDALLQVPQVLYDGCAITKEGVTQYKVTVNFKYLGDPYQTEVHIYG